MAMIIPADHQHLIGFPLLDLPDQGGVDYTHEPFQTGFFGGIAHELIVIPVQKRDIPFYIFPESAVEDIAAAGLLVGVEDLYSNVHLRQAFDPGHIVLNGMSSDYSQLFHDWSSAIDGLRIRGSRRIGANCC